MTSTLTTLTPLQPGQRPVTPADWARCADIERPAVSAGGIATRYCLHDCQFDDGSWGFMVTHRPDGAPTAAEGASLLYRGHSWHVAVDLIRDRIADELESEGMQV